MKPPFLLANSRYWLLALAAVFLPLSDADAGTSYPTVGLRLEWSSEQVVAWTLEVSVSEGELRPGRSLSAEPEDAGTIWSQGKRLTVQRTSPRRYDGVEFFVSADPTAELRFVLRDPQKAASVAVHSVLVRDVFEDAVRIGGDDSDYRFWIHRIPGDVIGLEMARPHMVFSPGEFLTGNILVNLLSDRERSVTGRVEWGLAQARENHIRQGEHFRLETTTNRPQPARVPVEIVCPEKDGVYDLHLTFRPDEGRIIRSRVQFVVAATGPRHADVVSRASLVEPVERSPEVVLVDGVRSMLVDELTPGDEQTEAQRRLFPIQGRSRWNRHWQRLLGEIETRRNDSDRNPPPSGLQWLAYRLEVQQTGTLHELVVGIPSWLSGCIGISILEPNAAGQIVPATIDTAYAVKGVSADDPETPPSQTTLQYQRIPFWPRVRRPIVLIHDLGLGSVIDVTRISVYQRVGASSDFVEPMPLAADVVDVAKPLVPITQDDLSGRMGQEDGGPGNREIEGDSRNRLVGPYLHKPLLPETFGGTEVFDADGGRSLDDWKTFYDSADRLTRYLLDEGYNSLLLAALADGSTVFPAPMLEPSIRYDRGGHSTETFEPSQKDVLELVFRKFDQVGLKLVPELQFSSPLPELERRLRNAPQAARGIELVNFEHQTWRSQCHTAGRGGPYYNPLHPAVQEAVEEVVRWTVKRYAGHPSFAGLAIELSSVGYLQFPGLEWGYDDVTVDRFAAESGLTIPASDTPEGRRLRYEFLTGDARTEWIAWRCRELARFHKRLAAVVTAENSNSRCILSGNRILRGSYVDESLVEAIKNGTRLDALLSPKGLNLSAYQGDANLVLLRPGIVGLSDHQLPAAFDQSVNCNTHLDQAFAQATAGSLFYHLPREYRLTEFDEVSPWQPAATWLTVQTTPGGVEPNARFAHAMAALDAQVLFDGGWRPPFGQELATRDIRAEISSLPALPFRLAAVQAQPIALRVAREQEHTYLYAVNEIDARVDVRIVLAVSQSSTASWLRGGRSVALRPLSEGTRELRCSLPPYGMAGCQIDEPNARLVGVSSEVDRQAATAMEQRIALLESQLTRLSEQLRHQDRVALDRRRVLVNGAAVASDGGVEHVSYAVGSASDATVNLRQADDSRPNASVVEPQYITADDYRRLTKLQSAVTLSWNERRYADCQKLLDSYWGRLLANVSDRTVVSVDENSQANAPRKSPVKAAERTARKFRPESTRRRADTVRRKADRDGGLFSSFRRWLGL